MKKPGLSRRDFLYGAAGIGAGFYLPNLPSLFPRAEAQGLMKPPKRVIFIHSQHGQFAKNYWPNFPSLQQFQKNIFYAPLNSLTTDISVIFGSGFNPYKSKMSLLQGLDVVSRNVGHQRASFLCSSGQVGATDTSSAADVIPLFGASIDWIMEQSLSVYPTAPRLKALRYNPLGSYSFSFSRINGVAKVLPYFSSDQGVFATLFPNVTPSGSMASTGLSGKAIAAPKTLDDRRILAAQKAIELMNILAGNRRLSSLDRTRLQDHVDLLNDLKTTYVASQPQTPAPTPTPTPAGSTPAPSPSPAPTPPPASACTAPNISYFKEGTDLVRKRYENVNSMIVAAFACDITRIACVFIPDWNDKDLSSTGYQAYHGWSHDSSAGSVSSIGAANKWIAERVLDLIRKLDSTIEADGSRMLDNTLIYWGNEQGIQVSDMGHKPNNMPVMLAGGANLGFAQGNYIDYRTRPFIYEANRTDFSEIGRPYNQLLASIMLGMGVPRSEFSGFGEKPGKFGAFNPCNEYMPLSLYKDYTNTYDDALPLLYTG